MTFRKVQPPSKAASRLHSSQMVKRRVWFNKSFSNVYNVIRLLQRADTPVAFQVVCSHTNAEFVGFHPSLESEIEPRGLGEEAYVEYCLAFCERRDIDVFVPGKSKLAIAESRAAFEQKGVLLLLAGEPSSMRLLEDKAAFYAGLDPALAAAPRFIKVNTADEFVAACETLRSEGHQICFKPSCSTGGLGFRILDDHRSEIRNLFGGDTIRTTTAGAAQILAQEPRFRDVLVMEYLGGAEHSIDCIATHGRLLRAVPRRKPVCLGGAQLLEDKPELVALAERLTSAYRLDSIFNIQVRFSGSVPKVLEINARMSGGVYFACLSGVNLPAWAIALACGDASEDDIPEPRLGLTVHQQYHEFVFREPLPEQV